MKKITSNILFALMIFLVLNTASVYATPVALLQLSQTDSIYVNDTFNVDIIITEDNSIAGDNVLGDFVIAFGFDVISGYFGGFSMDSYVLNSQFDDDSAMGFNPHDVGGSSWMGYNYNGSFVLATLTFSALNAGTDTLGVSGINDGSFLGLYFMGGSQLNISGDLDITVLENTEPIPEPSTMLLLGTGLFGFVASRKKKKS